MKCTASNGWYVQDIQEEDSSAFMMCFKDYPLSPGNTPISYEERLNKFSESLQVNEKGTLPRTNNTDPKVYRVWGLYKPDNTLVSAMSVAFKGEANHLNILNVVTHPDHRNQGYITEAFRAHTTKSIYPHYNITTLTTTVEASPTFTAMTNIKNGISNAGGNVDNGDRTSHDWVRDASGNTIATKDWTWTTSQALAITNANATWKDITFTIS